MDTYASQGSTVEEPLERVGDMKRFLENYQSSWVRMSVEGFNHNRPRGEIKSELINHFKSCSLWDINMDSGPVSTFQDHEYLKPKLCDLYENDSIFDKFECCISGNGLGAATGSYSNLFCVFGVSPGSTETATLEASRNPMRSPIQATVELNSEKSPFQRTYASQVKLGELVDGLSEINANYDKLQRFYNEPVEYKLLLAKDASPYYYTEIHEFEQSVDPTKQVKLGFLTGLVPYHAKVYGFREDPTSSLSSSSSLIPTL
ncbi:Protein phosphatase 2A regulatory subunit PR55 protein [Raphanus sativus]|nr:Protein phosphatase 2A regulatory subunit PR55 protein [Raphanus sativus]